MRSAPVVAAVTVLGAVAVGGYMHLRLPPPPRQAPPPAAADVSTVATSYLDAAVHRDCAFTTALTIGPTFAWCTAPTMTAYRDVRAPVLLSKAYAGRDEQCVSFEMTTTESGDGSIPAGDTPWSLCFVTTTEGWRVYDQGHL